jgi:hypothetical protein
MCFPREDRSESNEEACVQFYSNERTETLIKAIIGLATTLLLILPTVALYPLTVNGGTGGVKIGVVAINLLARSNLVSKEATAASTLNLR